MDEKERMSALEFGHDVPELGPAELVRTLLQCVQDQSLDALKASDGRWTLALKEALRNKLAVPDGLRDILFTQVQEQNHEFLLDLVAWDRHAGQGIALAVESEWQQSSKEITDDFWKLLVVKAPVKLMIFATFARSQAFTTAVAWEALQDCIREYKHHIKGERYIFIDFAPGHLRRAWWIEMDANGQLDIVPERREIALP